MDKILLGMLLFRRSTIYEIRNFIKNNMKLICSDSTGSIQAGIKKLLANNYVEYDIVAENGIIKKLYYVTPAGKDKFKEWISSPMQTTKERNMEFGKFFFLGMVSNDERIYLLEEYLQNLKSDRDFLFGIKLFSDEEKENSINRACARLEKDDLTRENLISISNNEDLKYIAESGIEFQFLSLDYAIAKNQFDIDWYTHFIDTLKAKN